jgi:hypothetical protein
MRAITIVHTGVRAAVTRNVRSVLMKPEETDKKLTLSKETLRTLDERDLSKVVGGEQSGANEPPRGGPNSCPNTKSPGCR